MLIDKAKVFSETHREKKNEWESHAGYFPGLGERRGEGKLDWCPTRAKDGVSKEARWLGWRG